MLGEAVSLPGTSPSLTPPSRTAPRRTSFASCPSVSSSAHPASPRSEWSTYSAGWPCSWNLDADTDALSYQVRSPPRSKSHANRQHLRSACSVHPCPTYVNQHASWGSSDSWLAVNLPAADQAAISRLVPGGLDTIFVPMAHVVRLEYMGLRRARSGTPTGIQRMISQWEGHFKDRIAPIPPRKDVVPLDDIASQRAQL